MRTPECGLALVRVRVPQRLGIASLTCDFSLTRANALPQRARRITEECLEIAQMLDYIGDVVFLEEADGGDAGGPGVDAGAGVRQRDSA